MNAGKQVPKRGQGESKTLAERVWSLCSRRKQQVVFFPLFSLSLSLQRPLGVRFTGAGTRARAACDLLTRHPLLRDEN